MLGGTQESDHFAMVDVCPSCLRNRRAAQKPTMSRELASGLVTAAALVVGFFITISLGWGFGLLAGLVAFLGGLVWMVIYVE
jgi:hypothetical protein